MHQTLPVNEAAQRYRLPAPELRREVTVAADGSVAEGDVVRFALTLFPGALTFSHPDFRISGGLVMTGRVFEALPVREQQEVKDAAYRRAALERFLSSNPQPRAAVVSTHSADDGDNPLRMKTPRRDEDEDEDDDGINPFTGRPVGYAHADHTADNYTDGPLDPSYDHILNSQRKPSVLGSVGSGSLKVLGGLARGLAYMAMSEKQYRNLRINSLQDDLQDAYEVLELARANGDADEAGRIRGHISFLESELRQLDA